MAEVAGREEHVGLEELAQAAHLGPEGERGVEVEAGRPEQAAEQEVEKLMSINSFELQSTAS